MPAEPLPGDIGLVQIRGDVGRLIRLGQWMLGDGFANYEHCFTFVGDGKIVEAEPGGARLSDLSEYDGRDIVWLRCPDDYRLGVASAARSLVGTPYSFADYLALALHRFHIPAPNLRRFIADSHHLICSSLADLAAKRGGWTLFDDGRWEGYIVPADIWRLIQQQNRTAA